MMVSELRRTKIIATLGPATDSDEQLAAMLAAGVNLVRINFSHCDHKVLARRVKQVKAFAKKHQQAIAIIADLQGPKIRIGAFKEGQTTLVEGATLTLDPNYDIANGSDKLVYVNYPSLATDLKTGDELLLDDGRFALTVEQVKDQQIICRVKVGGLLLNNKGVNRRGGGLSAKTLTSQDKKDLVAAVKEQVDYISVSFAHNAQDIEDAKALIKKANGDANVIVKIERSEALQGLDEMINAADGVMVARGDLGVEIGYAQLPAAQKRIIRRARDLNKPVIVATQMMESMIESTIPTRAEVMDVANAVLDNADAVMLSAETAVGKHPDKVVASMHNVCVAAESDPLATMPHHRDEACLQYVDEAIAMASIYTANHLNIKAIVCLTESGQTALCMSRIRTAIPIYAMTPHHTTAQRMTLYRGVYPIEYDFSQYAIHEIDKACLKELTQRQILNTNDEVLITRGEIIGKHGRTNTLKIITV